MGKKPDKGRDKGGEPKDDDPSKSPEPYQCTGNFDTDFTELCKRANIVPTPPVVPKGRAPGAAPIVQEKTPTKKQNKNEKIEAPPPPPPEDEADGAEHSTDAAPTTFSLKNNYDYMKPAVQYEVDPADKKLVIKDVHFRGWKLDPTMMDILRQTLPSLDKLNSLSLWNVGLTDETLVTLSTFLPLCQNLKTVSVESCPVPGEEWHRLMGEESKISNLTLRNNRITDLGASYIGNTIGTQKHQNQNLVKLNLAFNHISPVGAKYIANGLRMNRNLLVLDLAHNQIGDEGALALAHVISRFKLTHEEIVERRMRIRDQMSPERSGKSPPSSRKGERPTSKGSTLAEKKNSGKGAATAAKGKGGKDDKDKKDDKKGGKGAAAEPAKKKSNPPPVAADSKTAAKPGRKMTTPKGGRGTAADFPDGSENYEHKHPLDEDMVYEDGDLWVKIGNRNLISLNLNRNGITERAAHEFLKAVQYQQRIYNQGPKNAPVGLMRLSLNGNKFPVDGETSQGISSVLAGRDPLRPKTAEDDTSSLQSGRK